MLPISTKEPARIGGLKLPSGAMVEAWFLIKVPSLRDTMAIEAAVVAEGVRYPTDAELVTALREAVTTHVVDAEHPELLAIIDEYEAAIEEKQQPSEEVLQRINEIDRTLRPHHRPLAEFWAARHHASSAFALVRAEMLLLGIEGEDAPEVKHRFGRLTEATVEAIEQRYGRGTMVAIGNRTFDLTSPTAAEAKNSASPQPSPPGPVTSKAAKRQPTEAPGKSSEPSIPATLN